MKGSKYELYGQSTPDEKQIFLPWLPGWLCIYGGGFCKSTRGSFHNDDGDIIIIIMTGRIRYGFPLYILADWTMSNNNNNNNTI